MFFSEAQNLVPNPSFETYTLCPTNGKEIESAVPWTAATANSSTDYFNVCSLGICGVPYNLNTGFQYAHSGNAYAGLVFYVGTNIREYLQVRLISPLVQNKIYYVAFYVNLSSVNWSSACNNITANLSVIKPYTANYGDIQSLTPHIIMSGNPVITDTLNWVQISGCYTALGGEEYLTIGNFFDNVNTVITGTTNASYYYIDDVLVEEITGNCITGVNEYFTADYVQLFPNPANEMINVQFHASTPLSMTNIKICDVLGKEILNESYKERIDVSFFEKGIYFLSILQGNKTLITKKIVKE